MRRPNFQSMQTASIMEDPTKVSSSSRSIKGLVSDRRKNPRRMKFYEFYDYINQRYFVFTYLYSLFFLIGGIIGYSKTQNIYCITVGVILGVILLLFAIAHTFDYYRGVVLEAVYVSGPFVIAMFIAVLMTCIYSLGSIFKFSLVIAILSWIAVGFYFYAMVKDYSYGNYSCENRFIEPAYEKLEIEKLLSKRTKESNTSNHHENILSSEPKSSFVTNLNDPTLIAPDNSQGLANRKKVG